MTNLISDVPAICPRCGAQNLKQGLFCDACRVYFRDSTLTVERVTYTRRFFGNVILEGLLITVTLLIGWIIWYIFSSKRGQTPAKAMVSTYVINIETGRNIGRGDSWLREIVIKWLAVGIADSVSGGIAGLVDAIWLFFDRNRQTLHDKVLKQVVVYAPNGLPEDLAHLELAPPRYAAPPIIPAHAAAPPAPHVQDAAGELRELQRLKEEGLVTDEEYERKRAAIVDRM